MDLFYEEQEIDPPCFAVWGYNRGTDWENKDQEINPVFAEVRQRLANDWNLQVNTNYSWLTWFLGFGRKVPARRSCCVENRLGMIICNQQTPLPRLFSPCLIAARRLFVQTLGFGLCPTQIAKSHGLVHVLPLDFGFEVDVWIAMHNDLRKINRIAQVFEVLGEQLHQYLCLADQ